MLRTWKPKAWVSPLPSHSFPHHATTALPFASAWAWADVPSSLSLGEVSLPQMTEVFGEIFPIIKRICKETGTASSALKLLGPSWAINCAWLQPSSQSSYPFRRGKGSTAEFLPSPSLALQHQRGPLSVCFRPLHCQCIKDSHTRSFKVRRAQGQVQA